MQSEQVHRNSRGGVETRRVTESRFCFESVEVSSQVLRSVNRPRPRWFVSHRFLRAHARLSGRGVGVRGDAVLGEDRFKLLQRGVGSNPCRVEVSPTHPEAGLGQVLKKLVQSVQRMNSHK